MRSRLRAWDRERGLDSGEVLRFGGMTVDFAARSAVRDGDEITMTPLELDLLRYLAGRSGKAVPRAELLDAIWGEEEVFSRVVDTAILGLRKKVEPEAARPRHVVSVRGVGYRFVKRP